MNENVLVYTVVFVFYIILISYAVYWKMKAHFDALTGVFNKRMYLSFINKFCKCSFRNNNKGIIVFDIDDFKVYNDTFGHDRGDYVLKKFARSLKEVFSGIRFKIFRIGGDEFTVLFKSEKNNLINMLKMLEEKTMEEHSIKFSYGYAFCSEVKNNPKLLFEAADKMMFKEKKNKKFHRN